MINDLQKLEEAYVGLDSSAADVKFKKKNRQNFLKQNFENLFHTFLCWHMAHVCQLVRIGQKLYEE